MPAEVATGNYC